jgi:cyclic beta-1,2-glucan synthetase
MYRAGLEYILGFQLQGGRLRLAPCIPAHWPGFEIVFRYRTTRYEIRIENPHGVSRGVGSIELDGQPLAEGSTVALVDDGETHRVRVLLAAHRLRAVTAAGSA